MQEHALLSREAGYVVAPRSRFSSTSRFPAAGTVVLDFVSHLGVAENIAE